MMGATREEGKVNPSGVPLFTLVSGVQWGSCCLICSFLCNVLQTIVCLFSLLTSVLSVNRFTVSGQPFGVCNFILYCTIKNIICNVLQIAVCPFVLLSFFFAIVSPVLLRFTTSHQPFGIFKLFLYWSIMNMKNKIYHLAKTIPIPNIQCVETAT